MDGSCLKKNNQNFCTKFIQRHYLWHNIVIKWCELMGKDFNIFCLTKFVANRFVGLRRPQTACWATKGINDKYKFSSLKFRQQKQKKIMFRLSFKSHFWSVEIIPLSRTFSICTSFNFDSIETQEL